MLLIPLSKYWIGAGEVSVALGIDLESLLDREPEIPRPDSSPFPRGASSKKNARHTDSDTGLCN